MARAIGKYTLISTEERNVTEGVHRARLNTGPGYEVMLKLLGPMRLRQVQEQESFLQEAHFLAQLKHPNILPLYDAGVERGIPYIVMPYAPHGSLREHLKRPFPPRMPLREGLKIIFQVGQALQFAHDKNILHCNIKAENVLFSATEDAFLSDFELSSLTELQGPAVKIERETALYRAPEQFMGFVSKESDQYGLACLAFEIFANSTPFFAPTLPELRWKHEYETPIFPRESNPELPERVERAILRALAKRPEERHASIAVFMQAMQGS